MGTSSCIEDSQEEIVSAGDQTSLSTALFSAPGVHSYVVPANVTSVLVKVRGAGGGGGGRDNVCGGNGGAGGLVGGIIAVSPGQTISIDVGGGGGHVSACSIAGGAGTFGTSPFGVGGAGGPAGLGGCSGGGGGGGGASRVTFGTVVMIAGGGGGGVGGANNFAGHNGLPGGSGGGNVIVAGGVGGNVGLLDGGGGGGGGGGAVGGSGGQGHVDGFASSAGGNGGTNFISGPVTSTINNIGGGGTAGLGACVPNIAGSAGGNGSVTVTVAIRITAPTAGTLTSDNTPTVSGMCENNATIAVMEGATTLCSTTCVSNAFTCTSSMLTDGAHTIFATQSDGIETEQSTDVAIVVDTTPPPSPGILNPDTGDILAIDDVVVNGTCEIGNTVLVMEGANILCSQVCATGIFECTASDIADGTHTIFAIQRDAAGNASVPSADVSFTTDTGTPNAPVISSPIAGSIDNDATPTFSGTCESGATVTVSEGATTLCSDLCVDGTFACDSTVLGDGSHDITAVQEDIANHTSDPSPPITVQIDTVIPVPPAIVTPEHQSEHTDNTITITGTCENGSTVTIWEDQLVWCTAACANGTFTCDSIPVPEGGHSITISQSDPAGNESERGNVVGLSVLANSTDNDGDGFADGLDNCPLVANPDQADDNANGIGDACEGNGFADNIRIAGGGCNSGAPTSGLLLMLLVVGFYSRRALRFS